MEMARCMLYQKQLPKKFWAEAANTVVFFQNRIPTRAIQNQTLFEAWFVFKFLRKKLGVCSLQSKEC